jgi:hypothetical protein
MGILSRLASSDTLEERALEVLQELMRRGQLKVVIPIQTPPCVVPVDAREVTLKGANSYTMSEIQAEAFSGVSRKKRGGGGVEIHVSGQFRLLPEAEKKALDNDKNLPDPNNIADVLGMQWR